MTKVLSVSFEKRLKKIDIETKRISYYTTSPEDIIIAKLCSNRPNDFIDITEKDVLNKIDWNLLDELSKEVTDNIMSSLVSEDFILRYNDYKEKYKK